MSNRPELPKSWRLPFHVMPSSGDSWLVVADNQNPNSDDEVVYYSTSQGQAEAIAYALNKVYDDLRPRKGTVAEGLQAIWDAGGKDWEKVEDPEALLREIRGG